MLALFYLTLEAPAVSGVCEVYQLSPELCCQKYVGYETERISKYPPSRENVCGGGGQGLCQNFNKYMF